MKIYLNFGAKKVKLQRTEKICREMKEKDLPKVVRKSERDRIKQNSVG